MQRFFDLIIASLGLAVLMIPILFIWLVLTVSGCKPPLFFQRRIGWNGQIFEIMKFRTMTTECDSSGELLPDEDRITPLGYFLRKTSLDELPSLVNVIIGHMSLVGPRPLLVEYGPLYTDEEAQRHLVRPGVTGWAQVNGRNALSWDEKFKLDVWYVNNKSMKLYFSILFKTVFSVLSSKNISAEGCATMPDLRDERGWGES